VTPQETGFPPTLRVREVIGLVRAHHARPIPAAALAERFALEQFLPRQLGGLSVGARRRVAVALAFAGDPSLAVLDEPTTGLDREARLAAWEAVRAHVARGRAVLLTTHRLDEAEALADRVVLLERGSVVAEGRLEELRAAGGLAIVRFRADPAVHVAGAARDGGFLQIFTSDPGETVERLVRSGHSLVDLEVRPVSLEEALAARAASRREAMCP
jgi:ABC-2 type transport system ATP-binding protein